MVFILQKNGHIKTRKVRLVIVPGDVDQMASDTEVLLDIQTTTFWCLESTCESP